MEGLELPHVSKIQTGRASKDYGVGRLCAYPGCSHMLSRYNPETVCGHHDFSPSYRSILGVAQEYKICSTCGELKPATPEYFRKRKTSFEAQCKTCVNMKRRARKDAQLVNDGKRRCSSCNKIKPLTNEYWKYDSKDSVGLGKVCISCVRTGWKEASRESRKRKVMQTGE